MQVSKSGFCGKKMKDAGKDSRDKEPVPIPMFTRPLTPTKSPIMLKKRVFRDRLSLRLKNSLSSTLKTADYSVLNSITSALSSIKDIQPGRYNDLLCEQLPEMIDRLHSMIMRRKTHSKSSVLLELEKLEIAILTSLGRFSYSNSKKKIN